MTLKLIVVPKDYDLNTDLSKIGLRQWRNPYKYLCKNHKWKYVNVDKLYEYKNNLLNYFIKTFNELPKIILFYENNQLYNVIHNNIKKMNCITGIINDDIHHSSRIHKLHSKNYNRVNVIFAHYANCFNIFYPEIDQKKVIWLPHCVFDDFVPEFNDNPKYELLLSGNLSKMYSIRSYIYNNLLNLYPIDVLKHPGYKTKNSCTGEKYLNKINEYIGSITSDPNKTTKRKYIINKFFEIPGSGSLLIAGDEFVKNDLEKLGFKDNINYISINEKNAKNKLDYILDPNNKKGIDKIRLNGYNLIKKNHLMSHRAKLINDTFISLLK